MTPHTDGSLHNAFEATAKYLYEIDGDVSPELAQAIGTLRQLINECFVGKDKTVGSQLIYDIINPAVAAQVQQGKLKELEHLRDLPPRVVHGSILNRLAALQSEGADNE